MNVKELKNIILEEIEDALKERGTPPEITLNHILQYVKDPDEAEEEYDRYLTQGLDGLSDMVRANITRGEMEEHQRPGASPEELAADSRPEEDEMGGETFMASEPPLDEMARTSNIFKISQEASLKDVLQFMQRVNDVLKTYKSPGQKRPKKRFTPEEIKALATTMLKPEGFTSKDIIAATSYSSPAQANKFLAALEQKGLITITSVLKKSLVPDRDPNAPETRGRKRTPDEFDVADDPTGMDFDDYEDLDLSDPTSLYEGGENVVDVMRLKKAKPGTTITVGKDKYVKQDDSKSPGMSVGPIKHLWWKKDGEVDMGAFGVGLVHSNELSDLLAKNNKLYENTNMSNNLTTHIRQQISEAKNPLAAKLKEVEVQGRIAALESKLAAIQELVEETNSRLTRIDEDSEFSEMMDKKAVKDVRKQLKELERAEAKLQKEYDKVSGGRKKETVVDEDYDEDSLDNAVDEVEIEEDNLRFEGLKGVHDLKPMVTMNESLLRMQKLAGLITEGEYNKKKRSLNEGFLQNGETTKDDIIYEIPPQSGGGGLKDYVGKLLVPVGGIRQNTSGDPDGSMTTRVDQVQEYERSGGVLKSLGLINLKSKVYMSDFGKPLGKVIEAKDNNEKKAEYRDENNKKIKNPDFKISLVDYKIVNI